MPNEIIIEKFAAYGMRDDIEGKLYLRMHDRMWHTLYVHCASHVRYGLFFFRFYHLLCLCLAYAERKHNFRLIESNSGISFSTRSPAFFYSTFAF